MPRFLLQLVFLLTALIVRSEPVVFFPDWFAGAQFAGVYVAADQGFYRDEGIELTIEPFAFGKKPAGLIDAEPDRCALTAMEGYIFLQERGRGLGLRVLAAMLQESPAGYMSLESAGIRNAADFHGKRIGIHRYADPLYRWFLARAGVAEKEAPFTFTHDDVAVVMRGEIDALQGYSTEEFLRFHALAGAKARFISFRELGFDSYSELLVTTQAQVARHAHALQRFVRATQKGWAHALQQPAAAVESVARRITGAPDLPHLRASLDALRPLVSPGGAQPLQPMNRAKWIRMQEICVEMGFLKHVESPETFLVAPPKD